MKTTIIIIALGCLGLTGFVEPLQAAPRPTVKTAATPALPEIWQKVSPAQRLQYVRAAEMDATRILAERIMGISLDGETSVRELAAADDSVKGQVAALLRGVKTTEGPTYCDDGRVEVVRAVSVAKLIATLRTTHAEDGKLTDASAGARKDIVTVDALGNAAIPGSLGHERVLAKRAAEMDVYRRLAERISGIQVTADSTVKDFAVANDEVRGKFSAILKGAEITGIEYNDDSTATVTASVAIGPLVKVIVRSIKADGQAKVVDEKVEQTVVEEVGSGAAPAKSDAGTSSAAQPKIEVDVIIENALN